MAFPLFPIFFTSESDSKSSSDEEPAKMFENIGKGVKRNEGNISDGRPTKTPKIGGEEEVQAQGDMLGHGHSTTTIPLLSSLPSYGKMEALGITRISMDFEGETGHTLTQSFIESIQSCPTDLDLICIDGFTSVHRFILMGVSNFFFQLLRDRDMKDTEAITLVNVSITHLSRALELIYSGDTIVKESDEDGVHEVLDLFGINMKLERKEATEEDLVVRDTLQTVEVTNDDDDNNKQIVEGIGGTSGNEAETAKASKNNSSTVEEIDITEDDFATVKATDNESDTGVWVVDANAVNQVDKENDWLVRQVLHPQFQRPRNPMTVAEARPGQFDLREPCPTEGDITLNGKKIHWHLMEAVPSLTSPELLPERMRVFTLNIIKRPRQSLYAEIGNLFASMPDNSLEKRLEAGMMAVQCENYEEIDLVDILQPSKCIPDFYDTAMHILDVELVGIPNQCANLVQRIYFDASKSASTPVASLINKMLNDENARYNLASYKEIIYGNMPIGQNKILEISNIEELEDRAKALIKINHAGRIVRIRRFINPHFGWHEDYLKTTGVKPEIGGIGWNVWSHNCHWQSEFNFNVTGTQILFPMLLKDADLTKKVKAGQIETLPSSYCYCYGVAVSPKCLLENGISCFPVVQKPGMLIYNINRRCDISKLRLGMGAEMYL